jgi:hypothetical protein
MTDHPIIFSSAMVLALLAGQKTMTRRLYWQGKDAAPVSHVRPSPWARVKPGDRLWVRESFHDLSDGSMRAQGHRPRWYRADSDSGSNVRWRPSIHMPRWASRITLTVTATKIERLQDITDVDAKAEGIEATEFWREEHPPSICFSVLWNSLHGAGAWDANSEVVAISFTVEKRNIDAREAA